MLSRHDRDALGAAIRRYSSDEITAFEFDDALAEIRDRTADQTVRFLARALWVFYDDLKDHQIVATKAVWDLFQRMLLLLESDAELIFWTRREWTIRQPLAAFLLAGFVWTAFELAAGYQLIAAAVLSGAVSILLARWRHWSQAASEDDGRYFPFSSLAEIRAIRRNCPTFRKQPYPKRLEERRIRTWTSSHVMAIPVYAVWLLLGPLVLIFQMFPEPWQTRQLVWPGNAASA